MFEKRSGAARTHAITYKPRRKNYQRSLPTAGIESLIDINR